MVFIKRIVSLVLAMLMIAQIIDLSVPITSISYASSLPDTKSAQAKMIHWLAKQQDKPEYEMNIQFSKNYSESYLGEVTGSVEVNKLASTAWKPYPYIALSSAYTVGESSSIHGVWTDVSNPSEYKIAIYDKTDIEYFKKEVSLNSDGSWNAGDLTIRGSLMVHLMDSNGKIVCSLGDSKVSVNSEYEVRIYAVSDVPYLQAKIPLRRDGTFVSQPVPVFNSDHDIIDYYPTVHKGTKVASLIEIDHQEIVTSTEVPIYNLVRSFQVPNDDPDRFSNINRRSWIYDDALAVIAFSMAGDQERASKILSSLQVLQANDGSLEFAYDVYSGRMDTVKRSGAIAWVGYAAIVYEKYFGDSTYRPFSEKIADYLLTMQDKSTGSFKGGPDVNWYSTEHNIDCYFFFRDLYELSKKPSYFDAAKAVRDSLTKNHWVSSEKRFYQGLGDDAYALDTSSWGGIFAHAIGDESMAQASMDVTNQFYLSGQTLSSSTEKDSYNTSFVSPASLSGYKPYLKSASYPDAPDIVWSEGTWGVIALGLRLNQDMSSLTQSMLNMQASNSNGAMVYSNKGYAPYPYQFHVWSSVAGTAWGYMTLKNFQGFWEEDSGSFKQEIEDREAEEFAEEVFRSYYPSSGDDSLLRGASPWLSANTKVTPEVALEVLRNLSKGEPAWKPELSNNGGSAFFTLEGNPYTGIDKTKDFQIDVKIKMPEQALIFDEPALLEIYNKYKDKDSTKAEAETKVKTFRLQKTGISFDIDLTAKEKNSVVRIQHKIAERLMWNEVGEKVRLSTSKVGEVILNGSLFSRKGNGKFAIVADASKIEVDGGIKKLTELIKERGIVAEPALIESAEALAKSQQWTGTGTEIVQNVFRYGGKVLIVVGVGSDIYKVYVAEDKVKAIVESAGGWTGATASATAFAAWWTPADIAGPWAWAAHGVGTLAAGGVGYWVGSETSRTIYELVAEE
ncbi:hypothetical protein ACE3MZ_11785 [Paenibacillus sp. WLX1005]|uniref:hypothetical protein n=1 Tax=Paenibacillus sp. WLX1005 TaxID=3243766 RepID=UPI003984164A